MNRKKYHTKKKKETEELAAEETQKSPGRKAKECFFISTSDLLDKEKLKNFKVSSDLDAAYVRSGDKLFYKNKSRKEYVEIKLSEEKLQELDREINSVEARKETEKDKEIPLKKEQLKSITAITEHSHERLYVEFSPDNRKALAVICQIENADEIEYIKESGYSLKKNQNEKQKDILLQETGYTSWWLGSASTTHISLLERIGYFIWNLGSGFIMTLADVPWGLFVGLFDRKNGSLVGGFNHTPPPVLPDTAYSTIAKYWTQTNRHVAFGITYAMRRAVGACFVDVVKGAVLVAKQICVELPDFIKDDYYVGGRGDKKKWGPDTTATLEQLAKQFDKDITTIQKGCGLRLMSQAPTELEVNTVYLYQKQPGNKLKYVVKGIQEEQDIDDLKEEDITTLQALFEKQPLPKQTLYVSELSDADQKEALQSLLDVTSQRGHTQKGQAQQAEAYEKKHKDYPLNASAHDRQFAAPPYHLSPGEWEDILSAIPRGLKSFANGILHPIHAQNPLAGLVYNIFYFSGFFAVWTPNAVPFPQFYKEGSQWLGAKMAHNQFGQAVASAATQAPVSTMVAEVAPNGTRSMLAKVCHTVEESLVDLSVIMFLAWSGGVLLKSMPGIGNFIREEVGDNAGWMPLATYGGKAALLIHELCEAEELQPDDEEHAKQLKEKWAKLAKLADELEADIIKSPEYEAAEASKKKEMIVEARVVTDKENVLKAINKIRFLKRLTTHSHLLSHLPSRTKLELLQAAEELFADRPEMIMAVKNMLNPCKPYSVASRTLRVIIGYPLGIIRIFCSIGTGNLKQPVKDFAKKVVKDLTRVVRCVQGVGAFVVLVLYAGIWTPLRAVADLLVNDLAARMEGWGRGNQHSISRGASQAAAFFSGSYYRLAELLTPTSLYASVTHPDPKVMMGEPSLQYYGELLRRTKTSKVNKKTNEEKDKPLTVSPTSPRNGGQVTTSS